MFWHAYRYRLRILIRDRATLFWTLIFPLLLATLFYYTFGHITSELEAFKPIKAAIVDNDAFRADLKFQKAVEIIGLDPLIVTEAEAQELLDLGKITGIIKVGAEMELIVKQRGPHQTILKSFLDRYTQNLPKQISFTKMVTLSDADPNTLLGHFYALIAMTCMYCSYWGIRNAFHVQADQSPQGARRHLAPTAKSLIVLSDSLAALTIGFSEVLILLAYLQFILKLNFINQVGPILLISLCGCASGVALGNFVGTIIQREQNIKNLVLIAVNMTCSFFAGLMWVNIKDVIAQKAPLLAYFNPAALIADSFYSLYIYDNLRRFWINVGILVLITLVLSLLSSIYLRRERYASI